MDKKHAISKENASILKGLLAVIIVCGHCRNNMTTLNNTMLGMALTASGYLSVGVFFFLSGYGIETQFMLRGKGYLQSFPYSRLFKIFTVYALAVVFYTAINFLLFGEFSVIDFFWSLFFGRTVLVYGWYFQAILLMYLLYYINKKVFKENSQWVGAIAAVALYACLSVLLSPQPMLYCSAALSFPVGVFLARREHFLCLHKVRKVLICTGIGILFCITMLVGNLCIGPKPVWVLAKIISSVLFDLLVVFVITGLSIRCSMLTWLGKISLEIYLVQEVPMRLFRSKYMHIANDWLYLVAVLLSAIVLARAVHPVIDSIYRAMGKKCQHSV